MIPYLQLCTAFFVGVYVLETWLDVRQHRKAQEKRRPVELDGIVDDERFVKAQAYALDKSTFGLVSSAVNETKGLAMLWLGAFPALWALSGAMLERIGLESSSEIVRSLVFMLVYWLAELVFDLPFSLWSTFVIEQKHGFNKQTLALYASDLLKTCALTVVIGGPVLAATLYLIRWGGELFYLYVWVFMAVVQLVMLALYPNLIQPLFNKVEPLPDSPLKAKIEALAARLAFPLRQLYLIDGSRRSSHSNAYYYGFFNNKRIVLFDTLLKQMDEEEVVSVLAHELGHWALNHVVKNVVISLSNLFVMLWIFGRFLNDGDLYESFGFAGEHPAVIGLLLFSLVYSPIGHVLSFAMNILSRTFEFQADAFACRLGYAAPLRSGLIKLHIENLGNMNPDKWYSTYHHSHPPLVERLRAIGDAKTS